MKTQEQMLTNLFYTGYEYYGYKGSEPYTEFDEERINRIRAIIREYLRPRKLMNRQTQGSYQLKHAVEHYDSVVRGKLRGYVSNGEFIYAMILEGFQVEREGRNAYFNITSKETEEFYRFAEKMYWFER